ncbi:hypothetical protein OC834_005299 [Tilletia horrida]|uniref:Protein YIP n=1 Tax=Tilletia horrida TaxID=155126 RepID=A0AAN6JS74_9BASI|nr:hypothetical protein OC834_005299 [Tilletia horrida]KAK0530999.1 hypothetical protein OC835_003834 [Tilletia horrida]KAK0535113.1 hypothetical protein OC842_002415 [Tilletia horrida]KAK0558256.1 hypothetical protein OC844_005293 [Tilletia horrida]
MSAIFSNQPYGGQSGYDAGGPSNLQFYSSSSYGQDPSGGGGYAQGRSSLEGNMAGAYGPGPTGTMSGAGMPIQGGFWSAFGTGGFPDEPSLMEELGINFSHILDKSLTVLNPLHSYSASHPKDAHMMDDTDLAGPLIFCFAFAMLLLLAGKSQFSYIYGVALLGNICIYFLLNLMSDGGIDAYRVASVLGYCLLPLCVLTTISIVVRLDNLFGYILTPLFIVWSCSSASGIFVSILRLSNQRVLVAYPLALFYSCFAILTTFDVGGSGSKH